MYQALKPLLFLLAPEPAHKITMQLLDLATATAPGRWLLRQWFVDTSERHACTVMGLRFPNRVGLAAGFDKNGAHIRSLAHLGFGCIEVGTITPMPQAGNPQPRLFRLPADEALINRMGFNNMGVEPLAAHLMDLRKKGAPLNAIIGGNIGKNKNTPNDEAQRDYEICFEKLFPAVDYFVVNVSSPNTPGLRDLQEKEPLQKLLISLMAKNRQTDAPKPLLLKIAPDLTDTQLDDIAAIVAETGIDGIIATNTTVSREGLRTTAAEVETIGAGGLSGRPVRDRSTDVIRYMRQQLGPSKVIIGVGGIDSGAAAKAKLDAGADLVQVYTGLIYQGPGLVKKILKYF